MPCATALALLIAIHTATAYAAERVLLSNGFEIECSYSEPIPENKLRLYLINSNSNKDNYIDVASTSVSSIETFIPAPVATPTSSTPKLESQKTNSTLSSLEMNELVANAGQRHRLDLDLLASVIHAESGGKVHAVSRTGARGLMQLMPSTATELGVTDSFAPDQNLQGGSAYLDQLLSRYHENLALALAAYNAGPAAVDRYHGIPPYRETRSYVAHVIREFNRRKHAALHQTAPIASKDVASR